MGAHDMQEILDLDMFIVRAHAVRVWAIDIGRNPGMTPKPRIRSAETYDRGRAGATERFDIFLQYADHLVMWVAP